MDERTKLIEELYNEKYWMGDSRNYSKLSIISVVDFILSDRKRIVEPLVKALEECEEATDIFEEHDIVHRAIDQTLTLALGTEQEKK